MSAVHLDQSHQEGGVGGA